MRQFIQNNCSLGINNTDVSIKAMVVNDWILDVQIHTAPDLNYDTEQW